MSKKSRLFLALACVALVVTMFRFVHSITISDATSGGPAQNALIPGTSVNGELVSRGPAR